MRGEVYILNLVRLQCAYVIAVGMLIAIDYDFLLKPVFDERLGLWR